MTSTASAARGDRGGIRTEIVVGSPRSCPVAIASAETDRPACRARRSPRADGDGVVGEFELRANGDAGDDPPPQPTDCEHVFGTDTGDVYRFDDENCQHCPCEAVESLDVPLADVAARDGALHLTVHVRDVAVVRDIVDRLREHHDDVSVRRMRNGGREHTERFVLVDRNELTDRQLEVLRTAWEMGYFEDPRSASGTEVADELGISPSTFAEHLTVAQRKLLGDVLEE